MMSRFSEKNKGIVALVLLALIFASMGIFARLLSTDFTILQQTYLRIFAALLLGLLIFAKDLHFSKLKKISTKEWGVLLLRSVSLYLIGVTLISQAFITTKYSNASFISAVPATAILGFLLLKEKITPRKIMYILVGFAGVMLIAVKDFSHIFDWGTGDVFALISAFFFSLSYVTRRWHSSLLNNKEIAVLIFLLSSILLIFTSVFLFRETLPLQAVWNPVTLLVIAAAGLFNVWNLLFTNYGFQKVDAVLAGNILTLEAFFAVLLSVGIYAEIPTFRELLGGAMIIVSIIQMNRLKS